MNPTKSERSNSPELPTQTHVPHSSFPTPALVDSVAAGAHYSGGLGPRSVSQTSGSDGVHEHTRRRSKHTLEDETMRESVREPLPDHMQVLDDLEELYACRPTVEIFKRSWNKDGIFEDPLAKATGYSQYAAQWFALPKLFSKSEQISRRVMSSTHSPNRLVFSQSRKYVFRVIGKAVIINSIVIVDLDEQSKVMHLTEEWDGKDVPTRFGAYYLRRANGYATSWLLGAPKANE